MIPVAIGKRHFFTPLRYPGGKSSLYSFLDNVIADHGWGDVTYVEPYAGGAGVALALLFPGRVSSIVINDFDPAIYAFWQAATERAEEFVKLVERTPVTVEQWERQKRIHKESDIFDQLDLLEASYEVSIALKDIEAKVWACSAILMVLMFDICTIFG